jgi:hypothetical protein
MEAPPSRRERPTAVGIEGLKPFMSGLRPLFLGML